jgi:hypothetical protein
MYSMYYELWITPKHLEDLSQPLKELIVEYVQHYGTVIFRQYFLFKLGNHSRPVDCPTA